MGGGWALNREGLPHDLAPSFSAVLRFHLVSPRNSVVQKIYLKCVHNDFCGVSFFGIYSGFLLPSDKTFTIFFSLEISDLFPHGTFFHRPFRIFPKFSEFVTAVIFKFGVCLFFIFPRFKLPLHKFTRRILRNIPILVLTFFFPTH